ncbi:MAG: hypothetical protein JNL60_04745 [Bacteroidia bacterium]|nr:hypothetical protein [Bacteroidia bacterium]
MVREPHKRTRRILFTSEELSHMIAYRKHRERLLILKFKKTNTYRILNVLNICCIFIYLELLCCYFGPGNYTRHYSATTQVKYGHVYRGFTPIVSEIEVYGVNGKLYTLVVDEFIEVPEKKLSFIVGEDYILRKELKAALDSNRVFYRLFSASPVLFLCIFISFINLFIFLFNLNESPYPLWGQTTINLFVIFGILCM